MIIKEENQLTRAEFEAGQIFIFPMDAIKERYEYSKSNNSGYLSKYIGIPFTDGPISLYFCNVSAIKDTFFTYYFFLFGKEVKGKVLFSDCLKCEVK